MWDVATGRCEGKLVGHTGTTRCLAVSGGKLVSGDWDATVKVWNMAGTMSLWQCERTLTGHGASVNCVTTWGGEVASGAGDKMILV